MRGSRNAQDAKEEGERKADGGPESLQRKAAGEPKDRLFRLEELLAMGETPLPCKDGQLVKCGEWVVSNKPFDYWLDSKFEDWNQGVVRAQERRPSLPGSARRTEAAAPPEWKRRFGRPPKKGNADEKKSV